MTRSRQLGALAAVLAGCFGALGIESGCGLDVVGAEARADGGSVSDARSGDPRVPSGPHDSGRDDGAALDAALDGDGADAGALVDASTCPAACSSCAGEVCQIDCPGPKCVSPTICAAGRPCQIRCTADDACDSMHVVCAAGQPCTLRCEQENACNSMTISAATAASFCLDCAVNKSCNSFECAVPGQCARRCNGGAACSGLQQCDSCLQVQAACP